MPIRRATTDDFRALFDLGLATPEFKVSGSHSFMEEDEFLSAIVDKDGVFLVAEEGGRPVGFVYADWHDPGRGPKTKWLCPVNLVWRPSHRKMGISKFLVRRLRRGIEGGSVPEGREQLVMLVVNV